MTKPAEAEIINLPAEAPAPLTPMAMLDRAVASGASIEVLTKLMDLQERWERNHARKAYDEAMAAARAEFEPIRKNRHVGFDSKRVGAARTDYKHEDLAEVARTVDPILAKHGLSYRWRTTSNINEPVTVTCIVSHRLGYSEENMLSAGRDDTGNKNSIQAIGSTITYLQRYTLKAALGLAASNDDDGNAADDGEKIGAEDVQNICDMLAASKCPPATFLKWAKVEKIEDIPAAHYESCVDAIKQFKGGTK